MKLEPGGSVRRKTYGPNSCGMLFYWLLLGILCVWRVTHLLHAEDGPWRLVVRLRQCAGDGFWGELLDCFYCLSLWIAAPLAIVLGSTVRQRALLWPALSAAAILLERFTVANERAVPAIFFENQENQNVLRSNETEPARQNDSSAHYARPRIQPQQTNSRPASALPESASPMRTLRFENTGPSAVRVVSPSTGRTYRFSGAGARVEADPRDRALLTTVPGLRLIT